MKFGYDRFRVTSARPVPTRLPYKKKEFVASLCSVAIDARSDQCASPVSTSSMRRRSSADKPNTMRSVEMMYMAVRNQNRMKGNLIDIAKEKITPQSLFSGSKRY